MYLVKQFKIHNRWMMLLNILRVILLLLFDTAILFLLPYADPTVSNDPKALLCGRTPIHNIRYLDQLFQGNILYDNFLYFNSIRMSVQWQTYFPGYYSAFAFFLNHLEHPIRNNGLMDSCVEISFHETIIFNLCSIGTDGFLEQHSPGVLLIEE